MSTPAPVPPPPAAPSPGATVAAIAPTTGAIIGSAAGALLVSRLGLTDPLYAGTLVTVVTAVVTAIFHKVGSILGVASL